MVLNKRVWAGIIIVALAAPYLFFRFSLFRMSVRAGASQAQSGTSDQSLQQVLRNKIAAGAESACPDQALARAYEQAGFPVDFTGVVVTVYEPGLTAQRSIATKNKPLDDLCQAVVGLGKKPLAKAFHLQDPRRSRIQLDLIQVAPVEVNFKELCENCLTPARFEMGVDGLVLKGEKKTFYFLPGDAYTRSILSLSQLRRYLKRSWKGPSFEAVKYYRFRSQSVITFGDQWSRLFRGHPVMGELTRGEMEEVARRALDHVTHNQKPDGTFLYYYDSARNSFVDEEHPKNDPETNPYYNEVRHCGGGLLLLYAYERTRDAALIRHVRSAIDFIIANTKKYTLPDGREAAQYYYNKKTKLGGQGCALYLLSEFQRLTGDKTYAEWAQRLSRHVMAQILPSGEFIYYSIYLDKAVTPQENNAHFSFYYPGEALIGLAAYARDICRDEKEKAAILAGVKNALRFLLVDRPRIYANLYTSLPSDSWLMMAINELWDIPEMRDTLYSDFVFHDADQMVGHMYTEKDALFPDYVGAFYYNYGDFPYSDGARAEGLTGALALAVKMKDEGRARRYREALHKAAWAQWHLVNTAESVYFAKRPGLAIGGIRFKHTRQWFRIDTTQHVAAFYLKFLSLWKE